MKKKITTILIIVAIVAGIVTCPNKRAHVNALKGVISSVIEEEASSLVNKDKDEKGGLWSNMSSIVNSVLESTLVNVALESKLDVKNYYIFSVGQISIGDDIKNVSFGIFNHVYTIDKKDVINYFSGDK